jgi:hypothetical protein
VTTAFPSLPSELLRDLAPPTKPESSSASLFACEAPVLWRHVDAALQPMGMPPELSRIIAQFARTAQWTEDQRFSIDADGLRIAPKGSLYTVQAHLPWAVLDLPIGQLPVPRSPPPEFEDADLSSLRVWTIRIDKAPGSSIYPGIFKPTGAPAYDPNMDTGTYSVGTHKSCVYRADRRVRRKRRLPCTCAGKDAAGSLYHFTADLSSGTVYVRPIVLTANRDGGDDDEDDPVQWILEDGLSDLAEYRAGVAMRRDSVCSLLLEQTP